MMTHIFLSPHFDDAVYSCGGTIFQLVQTKSAVTIITVTAGSPRFPLPDTPVLTANHTRWQVGDNPVLARRREDENAAKILGADIQHLDIPDCIYRVVDGKALYPDEASLWGSPHSQDFAQQALTARYLTPTDIIYAPLGIGNHVDHQIVRDWAMQFALRHPTAQVLFYEDYPYMRERKAVQTLLDQFPQFVPAHHSTLDESAMQAKINAMIAYQSQISSFWADESLIGDEVRTTFTDSVSGQWLERFYTLG